MQANAAQANSTQTQASQERPDDEQHGRASTEGEQARAGPGERQSGYFGGPNAFLIEPNAIWPVLIGA